MIRRVFRKVKVTYQTLEDDLVMSIAVHAVNCTVGPDGITPVVLLFGDTPKLPIANLDTVPSTQQKRFLALECARKEMLTITAQRRVSEALKRRLPKRDWFEGQEGDSVLVYREDSKKWEGPFIVHSYDGRKTVFVEIVDSSGRRRIAPFSVISVKLHKDQSSADETSKTRDIIDELTDIEKQSHDMENSPETQTTVFEDLAPVLTPAIDSFLAKQDKGTEVYAIVIEDPYDTRFDDAKLKEVTQLLEKGTYAIVCSAEVPEDAVVLNSRFVLVIKNPGTKEEIYKARFVILGHMDPDKGRVVNEAPTVRAASVRTIVAMATLFQFDMWTRDVSQAFVQSKDSLKRQVYIRVPKGQSVMKMLGASKDTVLKATKPLYGLCESPGYWWSTFRDHHTKTLRMNTSVLDPCLFFKTEKTNDGGDTLIGMQGVLVDDTLGTGNKVFLEEEERASKKFETKPRCDLYPMKFNGITIEKHLVHGQRTYRLSQEEYSSAIQGISHQVSKEEFAHIRGQVAYVSCSTRPDVAYLSGQLSQVMAAKATKEDGRWKDVKQGCEEAQGGRRFMFSETRSEYDYGSGLQ